MFSLEGHTAIVTGGASGIGLATARMLSGLGANVVVADIDEEAGMRVTEGLRTNGAGARLVWENSPSRSLPRGGGYAPMTGSGRSETE